MAMVGVVAGSLQADSQPGLFGLFWGSAAAWRRAILITISYHVITMSWCVDIV